MLLANSSPPYPTLVSPIPFLIAKELSKRLVRMLSGNWAVGDQINTRHQVWCSSGHSLELVSRSLFKREHGDILVF